MREQKGEDDVIQGLTQDAANIKSGVTKEKIWCYKK